MSPKSRTGSQKESSVIHPTHDSDFSSTETKPAPSAPKCKKLVEDLRKWRYFEKSIENMASPTYGALFVCFGFVLGYVDTKIVEKYSLGDNFWFFLLFVLLIITLIAMYQISNALVIAKKPTWIAEMRDAMLYEHRQITLSDAREVAVAAEKIRAWVPNLTPLQKKIIDKILELKNEDARLGNIYVRESELLEQCQFTLAKANSYSKATGRGEDTTDLRHVLTTMIDELEEKIKARNKK